MFFCYWGMSCLRHLTEKIKYVIFGTIVLQHVVLFLSVIFFICQSLAFAADYVAGVAFHEHSTVDRDGEESLVDAL